MSKQSRFVQLFLIDGDAKGRVQARLDNWTGIAYKIPRRMLEQSKDRDDLRHCGVYFLLGEDEETGRRVVYIGQARERKSGDALLARCREHLKNSEKSFFNEIVFFTTATDEFGPTELCYLENQFCLLAMAANRYDVENGNEPSVGKVTEAKEAELDCYIENAKILMNVLGHKVLEPLVPAESPDTKTMKESVELFFERTIKRVSKVVKAQALWTNEGIVLKKGSDIVLIESKGLVPSVKRLRDDCLARKAIEKIDSSIGRLLEDQVFSSPSLAGVFVIGSAVNGRIYWKSAEGKTFNELDGE